ncbi:MAG: cob(I)yrinic acid a,c-diamide adenosyltransferase, partial [Bacteroidota bacterium]
MKIYTKTGDGGETSLFGGRRVSKDTPRIESYGSVDEINSLIGVVRSHGLPAELDTMLATVQDDLFVLGADLASPLAEGSDRVPRIAPPHISRLEQFIDSLDAGLPSLKSFILPGGSTSGSFLHFA